MHRRRGSLLLFHDEESDNGPLIVLIMAVIAPAMTVIELVIVLAIIVHSPDGIIVTS